jgi:hypothetical protein
MSEASNSANDPATTHSLPDSSTAGDAGNLPDTVNERLRAGEHDHVKGDAESNQQAAGDQQRQGYLIGTTVIYTLTDKDAVAIELRRAHSPAYRNTADTESGLHKAHEGPTALAGAKHPLMITSENEDGTVNGQVFLDGNDTLFVQSIDLE